MEAFYGGAAGGGKSDCLLMAALQYVDRGGYSALLLRQSYADLALPGALMSRAFEWLSGTGAQWADKDKTWKFPSGSTLTFGYLENERDKYRYQSTHFQYIGFDELTQFTSSNYRYMFSRLRRLEGVDIPLRMRSASNPGDLGHEWVKQRFIVEGREQNRPFIPAKLEDNPYLDRESYVLSLMMLDNVTREQLLRGDWSARKAGGKFRREWLEVLDHIPMQTLSKCRWARYWDLAATEPKKGTDPDWTVGCLMAQSPQGVYYVQDIRRVRKTPAGVEELIRACAQVDGRGVPIYMEQEPGASGVNTIAYYMRVLAGYDFHGVRNTGSKEVRANPLSAQAEAGNLKLVRGLWINDFIDESEAFPSGGHDDQVDAAAGAFEGLTGNVEAERIEIFDAMKLVRMEDL